mmetsp:Transcript_65765/g.118513  ORF Transcript_65765/g.118513 Transcript_65765/m.118513 type:complete len:222 (-) Transcript_65765:315-980(-)
MQQMQMARAFSWVCLLGAFTSPAAVSASVTGQLQQQQRRQQLRLTAKAKELAQLRQDLVRGLKGLKASIVEEDQRLETSEEKLAAQRSEPDPEPALSKCAKPWSKKAHRGAQLNSMIHLYANPPAQDAKDAKGGVEERRDDNNDEKKHEKKDEIKDMKDGEKKDAKKGEKNDDENKEKKGEKKDEEKKEKQGEKKGEEKQCEKGEKQGEKIAEKKDGKKDG